MAEGSVYSFKDMACHNNEISRDHQDPQAWKDLGYVCDVDGNSSAEKVSNKFADLSHALPALKEAIQHSRMLMDRLSMRKG